MAPSNCGQGISGGRKFRKVRDWEKDALCRDDEPRGSGGRGTAIRGYERLLLKKTHRLKRGKEEVRERNTTEGGK